MKKKEVKGRKTKILTAIGVMVLAISACSSISVSVPATAEATPPATVEATTPPTVSLPTTTPEAVATEVVATPLTEVLTPVPTETAVDLPIVFPEGFRNEGTGITFQVSEGARAIAETVYGGPIESIVVDPTAITALKNGVIREIQDVYLNFQSIEWNGRVEFIVPDNGELSYNGTMFVIDSDPSKHWDTNQPLNLFAVTEDEISRIRDNLEINHPGMNYVFTSSDGKMLLLFTDSDTAATNVYASVDRFLTKDLTSTSSSVDISNLSIVGPLSQFRAVVYDILINIGKNVGFLRTSTWMYDILGCDINNVATTSCTMVTIR